MTSMMTRGFVVLRLAIVAVCMGAACAGAASAQTSSNFTVTATVQNACTISAGNLVFGGYSPVSAVDTDGTSTLKVKCTLGASYSVALNGGTTATATITDRLMTNGSLTLGYNLYTTSGRTIVWGNGTLGALVSSTGTGLEEDVTVYGRIPAGQNRAASSYSDTVQATVSF